MCCLVVLLFMLAISPRTHAQTVYSASAYAGGEYTDRQWLIGTSHLRLGFASNYRYIDTQGYVIIGSDDARICTATKYRYTRIHLGTLTYDIHAPFWLVVALSILGATVMALILMAGFGKSRRSKLCISSVSYKTQSQIHCP